MNFIGDNIIPHWFDIITFFRSLTNIQEVPKFNPDSPYRFIYICEELIIFVFIIDDSGITCIERRSPAGTSLFYDYKNRAMMDCNDSAAHLIRLFNTSSDDSLRLDTLRGIIENGFERYNILPNRNCVPYFINVVDSICDGCNVSGGKTIKRRRRINKKRKIKRKHTFKRRTSFRRK